MNRKQLKTTRIERKRSNTFHRCYTVNNIDGRKPVSTKLKMAKPNLFDVLNNALLGTFREVFNAWNKIESKVLTYLKIAYNQLVQLTKNNKKAPLLLQLIPIDPKQEGGFVEIEDR